MQKPPEANSRPYQPRRQRKDIRKDRVAPQDWMRYHLRVACEDCSFYSQVQSACVIGFNPRFRRAEQEASFFFSGEVAFCRFLEID